MEVKAGDKIIKNGDQREFFFFVEKGCVEEFLPDGKLRFTHGAGDYFGEEAFLNKTNQSIDCVAKVDCCLLTLTEYSFRLDLDMARTKIEKGVVRYLSIP